MKLQKKTLGILFYLSGLLATTILADDFTSKTKNKILKQGEAMVLYIQSDEPIKQGTVYLANKKFTVFINKQNPTADHDYVSIIGISRKLAPKAYTSKISLLYKSGKRKSKTFTVTVTDGQFRRSDIVITGKKKSLASNVKQLSKEGAILNKKMKTITRRSLVTKPFIWPTNGTFTTPFGAYRSYNGKPGSKHSGTDIANITGTPILAANAGKVI